MTRRAKQLQTAKLYVPIIASPRWHPSSDTDRLSCLKGKLLYLTCVSSLACLISHVNQCWSSCPASPSHLAGMYTCERILCVHTVAISYCINASALFHAEFMQWFKIYYDQVTGGQPILDYDGPGRRAQSKTGDYKGAPPPQPGMRAQQSMKQMATPTGGRWCLALTLSGSLLQGFTPPGVMKLN